MEENLELILGNSSPSEQKIRTYELHIPPEIGIRKTGSTYEHCEYDGHDGPPCPVD